MWNTIALVYILIGMLLAELIIYSNRRDLTSRMTQGAYLWIVLGWPYVSYRSIREMLQERRDAD